jgi:hypothetical protein
MSLGWEGLDVADNDRELDLCGSGGFDFDGILLFTDSPKLYLRDKLRWQTLQTLVLIVVLIRENTAMSFNIIVILYMKYR